MKFQGVVREERQEYVARSAGGARPKKDGQEWPQMVPARVRLLRLVMENSCYIGKR